MNLPGNTPVRDVFPRWIELLKTVRSTGELRYLDEVIEEIVVFEEKWINFENSMMSH